jgi:hypothetical protein
MSNPLVSPPENAPHGREPRQLKIGVILQVAEAMAKFGGEK